MWPIAFGIGLLLVGLLATVVVCARMNDLAPPQGNLPEPRALQRSPRSKFDPA